MVWAAKGGSDRYIFICLFLFATRYVGTEGSLPLPFWTTAGFSNLNFSYPGPARAVIVGWPKPLPPSPGAIRKRKKDKGKEKKRYS